MDNSAFAALRICGVPTNMRRRNRKRGPRPIARFRTLDGIDVTGKRVVLRADFNVPMKNGWVDDTARIGGSADTLQALIDKGGRRRRALAFRPVRRQAHAQWRIDRTPITQPSLV
jgi:hypothetical protein